MNFLMKYWCLVMKQKPNNLVFEPTLLTFEKAKPIIDSLRIYYHPGAGII